MSRKRRLSLCMMVRDEAELLPGCLEAAQGVWDELVVVDTGSRDGTAELARSFGATVVPFAWCDDFAAGRNAGLAAAHGDWILFLDADERLSADLGRELRALLDDGTAGAATVVMRNRYGHGQQREARLLRLFRRDESIRFSHRIHEDVTAPVAAYLARTGLELVALEGHVDHLGYSRERMVARHKRERDRRILEQALAEDEDDLYSWFKLLEQAAFWQDSQLAERAAGGARSAVERADPQALAGLHFGGDLVAQIAASLRGRSEQEALSVLEGLFARVRPSAALHLRRGELKEVLGDLAGATASFVSCLAFRDAPGDLQLSTVRPLLGLARVAIAAGDMREAARHVRDALKLNPDDVEALTAAVVLRGVAGASGLLEVLSARRGGRPELHFALGEEALLCGETQRAVHELELAASEGGDARMQLRLAQALLADGRLAPAKALARRLSDEVPEAALGVLVCDLIEGVDTALELKLGSREADAALKGWVDALRQQRARALLGRFKAALPAVREYFPWLPGYLRGERAAGASP